MNNFKKVSGFTLVELMIVILVASILVSIAVPTYMNSVRKARRTEARNSLLDLAAREERFFNTNPSIGYTSLAANLGYAAAGSATDMASTSIPVGSNYYTLSISNIAAGTTTTTPTYTLTATAINDQLKDSSCRTYVVTQAGVQTSADTSSADTTATCWH
jgi:type IV pilus assembly protein PilE